jgi:hypothetical protein
MNHILPFSSPSASAENGTETVSWLSSLIFRELMNIFREMLFEMLVTFQKL